MKSSLINKCCKLGLLIYASALLACNKADISFGNQFVENSGTNVMLVDTFTVTSSSVFIDSFSTSGKGALLVGSYNDAYFGNISARTFFEVAPPNYADVYANTVFDSLVLQVTPNSYYYGDTTKLFNFSVYRLAEAIASKNSDRSDQYFNNQQFATSDKLADTSLFLKPNQKKAITIKLSSQLGDTLMKYFKNPDNIVVKTPTQFLKYFYGLSISNTSANAGVVYGFNDSAKMIVHYTKKGLTNEAKTIEFPLYNKLHQFNQIKYNRSGTPFLSTLSATNREISSTNMQQQTFLQSATGVLAKIKFLNIGEIQKLNNFAKILKAELVIRPVQSSYSQQFGLPQQLRLSRTNVQNATIEDLFTYASNGARLTQTGNLTQDFLYGKNTQYTYDVTAYIKTILNDPLERNNGLLLQPFDGAYQNQLSRLVFGNSNNAKAQLQLKVYYVTVQ